MRSLYQRNQHTRATYGTTRFAANKAGNFEIPNVVALFCYILCILFRCLDLGESFDCGVWEDVEIEQCCEELRVPLVK